jgi:hypothetical protein
MKCDDARSAYLAGEATTDQLRHLDTCAQCSAVRIGLDAIGASLTDDMFWAEPPPDFENRLVGLIEGRSQVPTRARSLRWWGSAAGVAAAVAAAVITVWMVTRSQPADWEVALPGTAEAPYATGVVQGWNEPGGTRLALEVTGLPEAPAGSVYELWLSEGSRHISSGTFVAAERVELWVGVARRDFPRLWITLEPLDEDESPSGVTVMDTG